MKKGLFFTKICVVLLCLTLALPPPIFGQAAPGTGQTAQGSGDTLRPEELDQLLAPIALYPDNLLAQVLTASTYPVEIVQAARFAKKNEKLKGDKLMAAAKDEDWDPSVKALLQFPDLLAMMDQKLDWTTKLGDAFLAQQREVMDSVQRLRKKALESGNLKTTKEQTVKVEKETIVIQPADPQVVYVPMYNPTVVYGVWAYPPYPPYPVYPPGYVAGTAVFAFTLGIMIGVGWGGWGCWGCHWGRGDININVNNYNKYVNNSYTNIENHRITQNVNNQKWEHKPEHRKGAQYKNTATAQKYGQQKPGTRDVRPDHRGYEGRPAQKPGEAAKAAAGDRDLKSAKPETRDSALSGEGRGGSDRAASFRGESSRSSAARHKAATRAGGKAAPGRAVGKR